MKTKKISIAVSDSIGTVSAEIAEAGEMRYLYVFAHGAGAPMNHNFMVRLSELLLERGIGTLRFNFPYMEKGSKRPDPPAISERAVLKAIETAESMYPGVALLAGGKSFGGRMTSQALSKATDSGIKGIVFVGFPLHAPGNPGTERAQHLTSVSQPMLFLQGTRDALARIDLIEKVCQGLPKATLKMFEGADHSFKAGKKDLIPQLADAVKEWTNTLTD
jgi:predicted alpha/beta-hydrolase family hydrolase